MSSNEICYLDIGKLDPNPFQSRIEYPEQELNQLRESIANYGILEPVIVRRRVSSDRFEIAAGGGRVKAAGLAGLKQVPCIIKPLTDENMATYGLVENLHRKNLNPVEEARGFRTLQEQFEWTQERVAKEFNLTRDIVAQRLRLITFPPRLQELVSHDTITPTHAEALARLQSDESALNGAIDRVTQGKLSTKETEQLVSKVLHEKTVRESILNYVGSPDFLWRFYYMMMQVWNLKEQMCPCCAGSLVQDNSGYLCDYDKCAWHLPFESGMEDIINRIANYSEKNGEQLESKP